MDTDARVALAQWVTQAALEGRPAPEILVGFGERATATGLPLTRAIVLIDTLDPGV